MGCRQRLTEKGSTRPGRGVAVREPRANAAADLLSQGPVQTDVPRKDHRAAPRDGHCAFSILNSQAAMPRADYAGYARGCCRPWELATLSLVSATHCRYEDGVDDARDVSAARSPVSKPSACR